MRIAIIGAGGQMGRYYTTLLSRTDLILVEIDDKRRDALKVAHPTLEVFTDTALMLNEVVPDGAIVATNTPSHTDVIVALLDAGVEHIFTEKPLCMNAGEIGKIHKARGNAQIYTAFLIDFSSAVTGLHARTQDLVVLEATVEWGKDRTGDSRPTAGNVEDESVHGMEFVRRAVTTSWGKSPIFHKVRAMLSHLPYADKEAQGNAHARDASFPLSPNSSSFVMEEFRMDNKHHVFVSTRSSFIRIVQERTVRFVFGKIVDGVATPTLHAMFEFDTEVGDILSLKEMGKGKPLERLVFKNNKLGDQVEAWLDVVRGEKADPRLTAFSDAVYAVCVTEAVKESAESGYTPVLIQPLLAVA